MNERSTARPPRLATWLLNRVLPQDGRAASIAGDLLEEFQLDVATRSRMTAVARYWRHTLSIAGTLRRRRPNRSRQSSVVPAQLARGVAAGPGLCYAFADQGSGVFGRRGVDAGGWHRRQHCHLQHALRRRPGGSPLPSRRPVDGSVDVQHPAEHPRRLFVPQFPRLEGPEPRVRGHGCLPPPRIHSRHAHRRAGRGADPHRARRSWFLSGARRASRARPHLRRL